MPALPGREGPPHGATRRPGRLGSGPPPARSLEPTSRTGAGAAGLPPRLPPREAEREKARPALPEKAPCGLCRPRLPRLPRLRPIGASRRRKVCSGPPARANTEELATREAAALFGDLEHQRAGGWAPLVA